MINMGGPKTDRPGWRKSLKKPEKTVDPENNKRYIQEYYPQGQAA
jgi:hypothetical protein